MVWDSFSGTLKNSPNPFHFRESLFRIQTTGPQSGQQFTISWMNMSTKQIHPTIHGKSIGFILTLTIWVFPYMVVPPRHPKMIIFGSKTHGWLGTSILGNPPYLQQIVEAPEIFWTKDHPMHTTSFPSKVLLVDEDKSFQRHQLTAKRISLILLKVNESTRLLFTCFSSVSPSLS